MRRKISKRQLKLRYDNIRKKLEEENERRNNCFAYKLLKYIKLKIHSFNNKE